MTTENRIISINKDQPEEMDYIYLESLRETISYYDYKYYKEYVSIVPDHCYDLLMDELKRLEKKYPQYVTEDSPTQVVEGGF